MHINFLCNSNCLINPIIIGGNVIKSVNTYKILGVIVDNDLKWNSRVDYIIKKACKKFYYSFKIFPRFGLVETTRIIHHNQLLFTKFVKNVRHIQSMTSKVEPAAYYSTVDVKMTSKVEHAADYSTVDRKNLGTRL